MDNPCRMCRDVLAPDYLDGLCENCFRKIHIEQKQLARRTALEAVAQYDREICLAVDKLRGPIPPGTYQSILHRCACGFASLSYIEVDIHIDSFPESREHSHFAKERIERKSTERGPRTPTFAGIDEETAV